MSSCNSSLKDAKTGSIIIHSVFFNILSLSFFFTLINPQCPSLLKWFRIHSQKYFTLLNGGSTLDTTLRSWINVWFSFGEGDDSYLDGPRQFLLEGGKWSAGNALQSSQIKETGAFAPLYSLKCRPLKTFFTGHTGNGDQDGEIISRNINQSALHWFDHVRNERKRLQKPLFWVSLKLLLHVWITILGLDV